MHSEARTVLDLLGGEGFSITLMTAGAGLAVHAAEVARWCDSVVVSLDGPPAVHDAIRGLRGSFRILNEGVRTLRHQAGRDQRITARCTVQRHNSDQLVRTVEVARTMGLDGISFLPVDTSTASFGRAAAGGWDPKVRDLLPEVDRLKELASELEGVARASGSSGFVAEDLQALRDRILHHFEAEAGKQAPRARPCNAPWVSAVVGIDGVTSPCFFHPAYGVSDRGTELGAFINAPTARAFRRGLEVASDPVCRRCVCPLALRRGEDPR